MAKHDAFGREIGEDTLAEAGWRAPAPTTAAVEPAAERALPDGPPVEQAPRPSRRRGGAPKVVVLVLLAFFALVGLGVVLAVGSIVRSFDEGMGDFGVPDVDTVLTQPPRQVPVPEAPAKGLEPGSLLRADALRPALAGLRQAGGRALMVRLAPDRIDTQLRDGRGMRILQVGPDGRVRDIARAPVAGSVADIDLAEVDPKAPERLLRSAERRFGLPAAAVDYLVLLDFGGEPTWNAFYRGGAAHLQARLDGRITRRVS